MLCIASHPAASPVGKLRPDLYFALQQHFHIGPYIGGFIYSHLRKSAQYMDTVTNNVIILKLF